jgi:hypothetical protein
LLHVALIKKKIEEYQKIQRFSLIHHKDYLYPVETSSQNPNKMGLGGFIPASSMGYLDASSTFSAFTPTIEPQIIAMIKVL